jgi:hypothetical protein
MATREKVWEGTMSEKNEAREKINPEAAEPSTVQSFDLSDRNPAVTEWGGPEAGGGQVESPGVDEQRVTPEGPAVSPDEGLKY